VKLASATEQDREPHFGDDGKLRTKLSFMYLFLQEHLTEAFAEGTPQLKKLTLLAREVNDALVGYDTVTGLNNVQYTAQFGNGVSATIGVDDSSASGYNRTQIFNATLIPTPGATNITNTAAIFITEFAPYRLSTWKPHSTSKGSPQKDRLSAKSCLCTRSRGCRCTLSSATYRRPGSSLGPTRSRPF
jgi:hypothetical protein